jgi:3-methylcrotonyl-CoA carboxylase alpha subunit
MITGTDLVEWQLQIAANGHLPKTQAELAIDGHAIEARIYAENPEQDFLPAAGTLWRLREPAQGPYLRIDTGVIENDEIGVFYDPMIAKLIVWGETRAIALQRLNQALGDYRIAGVTTNVDFLRRLSANPAFLEAKLRTDFIEQQQATLFPEDNSVAAAALANVGLYLSLAPDAQRLASSASPASPWDLHDAWRMNAASQWRHEVAIGEQETTISVVHKGLSEYEIHVGAATFNATATLQGEVLTSSVAGSEQQFHVFSRTTRAGRELALFGGLQSLVCRVKAPDLGADASSDAAGFKAPMNGTVVAMFASAGTEVAAGDTLAIMEAMKMEHAIKAPSAGVVTDVFYAVGDLVDGGADLLSFEATAT